MFDLSIWEILLALSVSIVILKPEDFPKIMRTVGGFFSKIKEISDELYSLLKEEEKKPRSTTIIGEDGLEHIAYDVTDVYGESEEKPTLKKAIKQKKKAPSKSIKPKTAKKSPTDELSSLRETKKKQPVKNATKGK